MTPLVFISKTIIHGPTKMTTVQSTSIPETTKARAQRHHQRRSHRIDRQKPGRSHKRRHWPDSLKKSQFYGISLIRIIAITVFWLPLGPEFRNKWKIVTVNAWCQVWKYKRLYQFFLNIPVKECKAMWKTLRDALRYRLKKKLQVKSIDSADERDEEEIESDWEFKDTMSFVAPMFLHYNRGR